MPTNTATLKTFAQQTRAKLISLITTKLQFVLGQDTAELRGHEKEVDILRKEIQSKGEKNVIEEVAYTWFNRVMALRYMDANGYNTPMTVSPATGQTRPEILQDAMGGTFDEELRLSSEDKLLPEAKLYRRLLVAICNQKYAEMPFLFERISDYTELLLPDDLLSDQSFVSDIRNGMTGEDCQNVELVGWLYQFYITDRKADAEVKKTKKGGLKSDEQAAATQLFTPHWVVRYMVENSLGRIWMTLHPESPLIKEMPYYIPTPEGQTDTIPEDIKSAVDIRFLDPCMGSGHILVYAFDLFTKMYEEEGYQTREIPALILTNNIFGIDIDRRCYQLASFALTMKARAYYSRYLRKAIQPNTIVLHNIDHDTIASVGNLDANSSMWQFENVDTIGSLLQITADDCNKIKIEDGLFGARQQLLKTQAKYLSKKYHCVVTNPPYLGKGMGDILKNYILVHFPNSKADTMATFMERCLDLCTTKGRMAMINMQSWMFLASYEDLRINLLENFQIETMLHLGPHAFDEIGGEVVQCATFVMQRFKPVYSGLFYKLTEGNNCAAKEADFINNKTSYYSVNQNNFEKIQGSPITFGFNEKYYDCFSYPIMENYCLSNGQNITGNNDKYLRLFWEVDMIHVSKNFWIFCARGGGYRKYYGNVDNLILWTENARNHYKKDKIARIISEDLRFKKGITWSYVCSGRPTFRVLHENELFEKAGTSVFLHDENLLIPLMGLLNSKVAAKLYHIIQPSTKLQVRDMFLLPIADSAIKKTSLTKLIEKNISLYKQDWDAHETSWDFCENELISVNREEADLNGGRNLPLELVNEYYKSSWEYTFNKLHSNEEELNRQFIEIYGLQDELTPDVPLSEITILQKGEITIEDNEIVWHEDIIIKQLISYLVGCFMGRYSIDRPGLIIASQHQDLNTLGLKVEGIDNNTPGKLPIDDDGIVPIIEEEDFFADDMTQRIEQAIKVIFGEENYHANLKYINEKLGKPLREYLFKDFYSDHIDGKMYQKRPIYWLFSSKMGEKKKKGYFKALVYMHRMEPDTLSKLHADYVHPYLNKIERQLSEAEDQTTRDDLTQAQRNKALKSVEELRDKVREVHAFEQQLVEMASHRLSIDLDDGVKANYPKYYPLVEPIKGLESDES